MIIVIIKIRICITITITISINKTVTITINNNKNEKNIIVTTTITLSIKNYYNNNNNNHNNAKRVPTIWKIQSKDLQVSSVQSLLRIKLCQSTFMLSKVLFINTVNTPQVLPTKIDHRMLDLTNELHLLHCHGASLLSDTRLKFSAMHSLRAATPTRAAVVARNILMDEVAMQTKLDEPKCCNSQTKT